MDMDYIDGQMGTGMRVSGETSKRRALASSTTATQKIYTSASLPRASQMGLDYTFTSPKPDSLGRV
jgi:hypothetical protein